MSMWCQFLYSINTWNIYNAVAGIKYLTDISICLNLKIYIPQEYIRFIHFKSKLSIINVKSEWRKVEKETFFVWNMIFYLQQNFFKLNANFWKPWKRYSIFISKVGRIYFEYIVHRIFVFNLLFHFV